jgi:hypothetical protein
VVALCDCKTEPVASSPLLDPLLQVGILAYTVCAARCTMQWHGSAGWGTCGKDVCIQHNMTEVTCVTIDDLMMS